MIRNRRLPWLFATTLLAASPQLANAATVIRTLGSAITATNSGSATFSFADITSADQLVSIGAGSVTYAEGGTFTISVRYTDNSTTQIFSDTKSSFPNDQVLNLASVANLSFSSGNINALIFNYTFGISGNTVNIPAGTQFTFHTADVATGVPEPIGWATMIGGFAAVGALMRGRRRTRTLSPG